MVVLNVYVRQFNSEENSSLFMNSISYKLKNEGRNLKSVESEISQDYAQTPGVNEVNGTYGAQVKGILHLLVRWAHCAGTKRFLSCLGCY
jgi:hypothetical protein